MRAPSRTCRTPCDVSVPVGSTIELTAAPSTHWRFVAWSTPSCPDAVCTVSIVADVELTATFERVEYPLTVVLAGGGAGTVTSTAVGLECPSETCEVAVESEQQVRLRASPAAGATFAGWTGACAGLVEVCAVDMDGARTVTATFEQDLSRLDVVVLGEGRVTSTPAGVDCPGRCLSTFDRGQTITLEASPGPDQRFTGWGGACAGTGPCEVVLSADRSITATFEPVLATILIRREGDAAADGVVQGAGGSIACPSQCTASLPVGTSVTLDASTSINTALFDGWPSGPCAGQGARCTFVVQPSLPPVAAAFARNRLVVSTSGEPGRISSDVGGIDCGTSCSAVLPVGTTVRLTAQPATNDQRFDSWTGACAGQAATCTLTLTEPDAADATFILRPPPIMDHQAADFVLGQPDFSSNTPNNAGESLASLNRPRYCHTDGTHLWVSDSDNARVLQWNSLPTTTMQPADVVIGQASATQHNASTTQSTLQTGVGDIFRAPSGGLYVADTQSSRVLYWSTVPSTNGASATAVLGQVSFTSASSALGPGALDRPYGLEIVGGRLLIADSDNSRVVVHDTLPMTSGLVAADRALGQANLTQNLAPSPPSAATMNSPYDAHYDPVTDRLFVADTNNHRVLGWNGYPSSPRPADFVLGQTDSVSNAPDAGQASPNAVGMAFPRVVFVLAGSLFVSDPVNSRVLVWTPVPGATGTPATAVLGQPNLNVRGLGTSSRDMHGPWGICGFGTRLFVVDINNSRVGAHTLTP